MASKFRQFGLSALFLNGVNITSGGGLPPPPIYTAPQAIYSATQYGAKCDGVTDDSAAINNALNVIRALVPVPPSGPSDIGRAAKFILGSAGCLITNTVNMTGLYGAGFVADFSGSTLLCETNGAPCIDATGDGQITIKGLNIYAPAGATEPNIGLALGRVTNDGRSADHNMLQHPVIVGYYSVSPFYNNQSETTEINGAQFVNYANNSYGAIWDGSNHFNFQSAFTGHTYPPDTYLSFNENTCFECILKAEGATGSVPIWIGSTAKHRFLNSYVHSASNGPEVILYFPTSGGGSMNDMLDLDIHFEGPATSLVQFQGSGAITQNGLRMRDYYPEQNGPLFSRGVGVITVTIGDAHFEFGTLAGTSPSWWDDGTKYTVSGYIYERDGSYSAPSAFTGMLCGPTSCAIH